MLKKCYRILGRNGPTKRTMTQRKVSLEKRDYFAYVQSDQQFVTVELRAIKGSKRWAVRVFSFMAAVFGDSKVSFLPLTGHSQMQLTGIVTFVNTSSFGQ